MIIKNVHTHKFIIPELIRIIKIDNKNYKGTAGDKAFLSRTCGCGKKQAFEYGDFKEMEKLFKEYK